jgi:hypothetical protein
VIDVTAGPLSLDEAVDLTRTGDLWLFRGGSLADRAIRTATNSPVNHVGMAVVLEDLPPLMWHAELGRSLPDVWTGQHHRGVQLHDLRDSVVVWCTKYGQRAWLRQLHGVVTPEMEDALLQTIARLDGTPFPSTVAMATGWLRGRAEVTGTAAWVREQRERLPRWTWRRRDAGADAPSEPAEPMSTAAGAAGAQAHGATAAALEYAYCAEVVAVTYQAMGLLADDRPASWYDPGRFWSGDDLRLRRGAQLGDEVEVRL